jgi:hypothetical protein
MQMADEFTGGSHSTPRSGAARCAPHPWNALTPRTPEPMQPRPSLLPGRHLKGLGQADHVARVVPQGGLDAVGPLTGRRQECHALR